jgi:hypothetical protein
METENYYMVCFDSSQRAIQVEKALSKDFENIRLVPIPTEIRVSCGIGIKVSLADFEKLKSRVRQEMVYLVTRKGSKRSVEKCEIT